MKQLFALLLLSSFQSIAIADGKKLDSTPPLQSQMKLAEVSVPDLFDGPIGLIEDGAWEHSCEYENGIESSATARLNTNVHMGDHYFFFSLSQFLKDPKAKQEMRFYKDASLKGKPTFLLNKLGLHENGMLICKWDEEYSEKTLYLNFLTYCLYEKHEFLIFPNFGGNETRACGIINVKNYSVSQEKYSYQVEIGKKPYYLDVSQMPDLENGKLFLSKQKRARILYDKDSTKKHSSAEFIVNFKKTKLFEKVYECFLSKNVSCLQPIFEKTFHDSVASAGSNMICNAGLSSNSKIPKCSDEHNKKITETEYFYLAEFLKSILDVKVETISSSKPINGTTSIYFKPANTHTEMNEAGISIDITDDKILFKSIDDGNDC